MRPMGKCRSELEDEAMFIDRYRIFPIHLMSTNCHDAEIKTGRVEQRSR